MKTIIKNLKYSLILPVLMMVSIQACIKPLDDFDLKNSEPKIVVNGIFDPDSAYKLQVVSSIGALDVEDLKPIENAVVQIYENNNLVCSLDEFTNGYYQNASQHPEYGKSYRIAIDANGYKSVEIMVFVPEKLNVLNVDTSTVVQNEDDFNYDGNLEIETRIENSKSGNNYYIIQVKTNGWHYEYDYENLDSLGQYKIVDSVYSSINYTLSTKDFQAELTYSYGYVNSYENWVGDYSKSGEIILYSDRLSPNSTVEMNTIMSAYNYYYDQNTDGTVAFDVIITEVNEDFYYYLKALSKYRDDPFENFFAESVTLYSNVENGIGIVFGQSSEKRTFQFNFNNE